MAYKRKTFDTFIIEQYQDDGGVYRERYWKEMERCTDWNEAREVANYYRRNEPECAVRIIRVRKPIRVH